MIRNVLPLKAELYQRLSHIQGSFLLESEESQSLLAQFVLSIKYEQNQFMVVTQSSGVTFCVLFNMNAKVGLSITVMISFECGVCLAW